MDLGLKDRVYIVTGGARGLGRATADLLVAEGARVVLSGRNAGHPRGGRGDARRAAPSSWSATTPTRTPPSGWWPRRWTPGAASTAP